MFQILLSRVARIAACGSLAFAAMPAFAHEGGHAVMSMAAGFVHPFSGVDHLLAMLAVGLWAAQSRRSTFWVLPLVFPLMMALGAVLGMTLGALPGVELGVASSVAVLGLLIAFAVRLPFAASVALVALFAMAHGYAHGTELPPGASALLYGAGFMVATAVLHLVGWIIGSQAVSRAVPGFMRWGGSTIAAVGAFLMVGAV